MIQKNFLLLFKLPRDEQKYFRPDYSKPNVIQVILPKTVNPIFTSLTRSQMEERRLVFRNQGSVSRNFRVFRILRSNSPISIQRHLFIPLLVSIRERNMIKERNKARKANLKLVYYSDGIVDVLPLDQGE